MLNWWRIFPDVFKCVQMEVYTYLDVYCILCVGVGWHWAASVGRDCSDNTHCNIFRLGNTHCNREEYKEYTQQWGRVIRDFATLKSQHGNFATYMRILSIKIGPKGNCPSLVGCGVTQLLFFHNFAGLFLFREDINGKKNVFFRALPESPNSPP